MTTSPVTRLQEAIERLERLKAKSTPGVWEVDTNAPFSRDLQGIFSQEVRAYAIKFDWNEQPNRKDAELIVTLHRTIDAQLAILAYGATLAGSIPAPILALADAILGGAQ